MTAYYLGIDFGTSGARAIVINDQGIIQVEANYVFGVSAAHNWLLTWEQALFALIEQIPLSIRQYIQAIALNGTSATVLLCDATGKPVTAPILYNDGRGVAVMERLRAIAPPEHVVISATSSLAKLLWWYEKSLCNQASYFLHQADWLGSLLHGKLGISDYHNALKLGYDVERLCYPDWLTSLSVKTLLPQVFAPGAPVAEIIPAIAARFNLPASCVVHTGTTDSIAAFIASGAKIPGEAVTSLGSTLVLKLLSHKRIEDSRYGIYSHRWGDLWLTGGASNTGGAVLKHFFSDEELVQLSGEIDPYQKSYDNYYPLLQPGERFPVNDPQLQPQLEPQPDNKTAFLHNLLASMAKIESQGYQLLHSLGANKLHHVYTAGGGAKNPTWMAIRQGYLGVSVSKSIYTQAAYGTALLAKGNV